MIELIKEHTSNLYVSCSKDKSKVWKEEYIRLHGFLVQRQKLDFEGNFRQVALGVPTDFCEEPILFSPDRQSLFKSHGQGRGLL